MMEDILVIRVKWVGAGVRVKSRELIFLYLTCYLWALFINHNMP